jgi:hypothetical protein
MGLVAFLGRQSQERTDLRMLLDMYPKKYCKIGRLAWKGILGNKADLLTFSDP